ncbi:MAG TPA: hypothetical protein VGG74_18290 [Kofleriaceae bacterium]
MMCALAACGGAPSPPPAAPTSKPPPPQSAPKPEDQLVHGHPNAGDFDALIASFPTLSADRRAAIAAIGTSENAPIRVPDIKDEYVWVGKIACNGSEGQVQQQALLRTATGDVDELEFTCPGDDKPHAAYFDFSADPTEQAMKKELGQ